MNAKEMLKQAVRQVCEEAGEPWEELYEEDFDDTTVSKTAEVFATLVLAEHAAELDALRTENARLRAELEAVGSRMHVDLHNPRKTGPHPLAFLEKTQ